MNSSNNGKIPLPTRHDFDPTRDCLDANHAWEMFGGLTVDEAYAKFLQHPQFYQEDFMFMGGAAFAFYFPVIERYVLEVQIAPQEDDEIEALWILAHAINAQLAPENSGLIEPVVGRIRRLTAHVLGHLDQYGAEQEDWDRLSSSWSNLTNTLQTFFEQRSGDR